MTQEHGGFAADCEETLEIVVRVAAPTRIGTARLGTAGVSGPVHRPRAAHNVEVTCSAVIERLSSLTYVAHP